MKLPSEYRREQVLGAARLYFLERKTTSQVAQELNCSRWTVRRLLQEAYDEGYVSIEIVDPYVRVSSLEKEITNRFSLSRTIVVRNRLNLEDTVTAVANESAKYLAGLKPMPQLVGVSWGRTLAKVAKALESGWAVDPMIVQLNGGVAALSSAQSVQETILSFAQKANGKAKALPCPAIVSKVSLAKDLREDPGVVSVLDIGRQVDVAIFSLGALRFDSVLVESGCITRDDVSYLRANGGVGDILGRFINGAGEIVSPELESRTIGIDLKTLKRIKNSIGVAVGENKASITRAALKGGFMTTLITDEKTAKEVLAER
ncbi:sugar-binding domain-containing protein [uncultured Varibaculum sp.]|uniref:sugar-binding transcriptional regulator n=1 Tax=uncultured Varibaculum sp. TaxID=413896 RepID=UPI002804AD9A|nr:sugar-binding domain-containing protein [uncultured Varibaculum sp.]